MSELSDDEILAAISRREKGLKRMKDELAEVRKTINKIRREKRKHLASALKLPTDPRSGYDSGAKERRIILDALVNRMAEGVLILTDEVVVDESVSEGKAANE